MRKQFLSCTVIGLILFSACAPSAVTTPTPTVIPTATSTLTPTNTPPVPAVTNTPLPLTHLDLWLSIEDDPAAPPIGKLKVNSVSALYIWAKAPEGVEGDFTLWATYQHGGRDQLGYTFHARPDGQPRDCGVWSGRFLNMKGTVILEAYAGDLLLGSFKFSID
ncbi:MAG: hypothetical protein HZB19_13570 [Chloroflexi bacterium]|nr:hypothetical protein [Chloroflexota bacterium]